VVWSPDGGTLASGSWKASKEGRRHEPWRAGVGGYERLNITGIRGLTQAQKATLRESGAVDVEESW
jgi:hypothetical protein